MKRSFVLAIVGTLSLAVVVAQDTTKVIDVEQLENNLFVPLFDPPTYVGDLELVVPARACPGGGGGANWRSASAAHHSRRPHLVQPGA